MNKAIAESVRDVVEQLTDVLSALEDSQYAARLPVLSGASVGEHVRHVIEFFQELEAGYQTGLVDYDARKREKSLETLREYARMRLQEVATGFQPNDKTIQLTYKSRATGTNCLVATSYERELLYNLEHAIHHMALIRIGVQALADISLPDDFGIASSTIEYRQAQCAQ